MKASACRIGTWAVLVAVTGLSQVNGQEFQESAYSYAAESALAAPAGEASPSDAPAADAHGHACYGDACCGDAYCGDGCCDPCCNETCCAEYFFGVNAWQTPGDFLDDNFGAVSSFNTGYLLTDSIGLQFGASYGVYDFHGDDLVKTSHAEEQTFVTLGVYQRSDVCCGRRVSWGVVWDYMHDNNYGIGDPFFNRVNDIDMHQIRAQFGYALNCCHEIGVWGNWGMDDDEIVFDLVPVEVVDQYNVYLKSRWGQGETMIYAGIPDGEPGEFIVGMNGTAPLSCTCALTGGFHYIVPSTTGGGLDFNGGPVDPWVENEQEIWNLYFGVVFYSGCGRRSDCVSGDACRPLMPVANNGTMPVTIPQGLGGLLID